MACSESSSHVGIWWEEYSRQWVSKCKGPEVGTRLVCLRKIQKSEEGGERARAPEEALVNPGEAFRFYFKQEEKLSTFCDLIYILKKVSMSPSCKGATDNKVLAHRHSTL